MIKKIDKYLLACFVVFAVFVVGAKQAKAVMPPDFIFNIGSQVAQVFSIIFLFISAFFGVIYKFIRIKFSSWGLNKYHFIGIIILLLIICFFGAFLYSKYKQKNEYDNWIKESRENEEIFLKNTSNKEKENDTETVVMEKIKELDSDKDGLSDREEIEIYKTDPFSIDTDGDGYNDKTEIDNNYSPLINESLTKKDSEQMDKNNEFIKSYYHNIASGNLEKAYEMSKQTVSFEVFSGWYKNTTDIRMDKIVRIDEEKSSLELTLFEGDKYIRYGVLMTLRLENSLPVQVKKSEVRILEQGLVVKDEEEAEKANMIKIADEDIEEYNFYEKNKNISIVINNDEFKEAINGGKNDYIVLDAREDIEYQNGNFQGSLHIRFADLRAGRWIEIPNDKRVYVLCWSGLRGKEVAEFLRTKKVVASYLENGAKGWYDYGGVWNGNIMFADKYSEERFRLVFSVDDVKKKVKDGAFLVDCREPYKFNQSHIGGSVNIPIMYTPSINFDSVFSKVPAGSKVITICDDYVNCFDAKLTGVELEARGHQFLGRFNRPWEY